MSIHINERCLHLWHVVRALGKLGTNSLLELVGLGPTLRGLELEKVDMIPHLGHLAFEGLGLAHDYPVSLVVFLWGVRRLMLTVHAVTGSDFSVMI